LGGGRIGQPGDEIFVYRQRRSLRTESAPGIRLKAIRDGIQDYEYAQSPQNLWRYQHGGHRASSDAAELEQLSHDPNALQNARTSTGATASQLSP